MQTSPATADPLDLLWTPEQREAGREACRAEALVAAQEMIEHDEAGRLPPADVLIETTVGMWLADHDARVARAAEIMRSPEAVGREALARQLVRSTQHSPLAARTILADATAVVSVLPTGRERQHRIQAVRRAATIGGAL